MKLLKQISIILVSLILCTTTFARSEHNAEVAKQFPKELSFGSEQWKRDFADKNDTMMIVEYTANNENVHNWTRLFTYQELLHKLPSEISPKKFAENIETQIKRMKLDAKFTFIETADNEAMFEFQIMSPKEHIQDEIQRIILGKNGDFYVIHYVVKNSDMGYDARQEWIKNLKEFKVPLRR